MHASYIEAIQAFYPERKVSSVGDGYDYDTIVADDGLPLPSKEDLDEKCLKVCQDKKWREIQAERDRRKYNGVKVGDFWFHTDDGSRIQQIALLLLGASLPPVQWKTLGGTFVTMTPTLANQIFQATTVSDITIFSVAEQHKRAMYQSNDPSNYDFSQGWPETYVPSTSTE